MEVYNLHGARCQLCLKKQYEGFLMEKTYKVLKKAVDRVGIKPVACALNVSQALVYKWCQNPEQVYSHKTASGATNPLDRLVKIVETTGDVEMIKWLCKAAGGYYVEDKIGEELPKEQDVLINIQQFIKEFSETLDKISACYSDDGKISKAEAREIRTQWEDLKSMGEGFVMACEAGKYSINRRKQHKK